MARRRRGLGARLRRGGRELLAFLFSNVGVVVLVVGYTTAGASIFQAIEGASEMERANNMTRERDSTADYLWQNITLALNLFNETELRLRISSELAEYQRKVVLAVRRGWDGARDGGGGGGRGSRQWSFSSAFLYSLTVITTIGYGNLSPRTAGGKLATVLYALLGMPLFLLYLATIGELLARWFKCVYALACRCRGCPGLARRRAVRTRPQFQETSEAESIERPREWRSSSEMEPPAHLQYHYYQRRPNPKFDRSFSTPNPPRPYRPYSPGHQPRDLDPYYQDYRDYPRQGRGGGYREDSASSDFTYVTFDAQTITVPISVCVGVMVGYIIFGSMIFGLWEQWDQLDGAYFCFISLSSIGFGDFVPGERVVTTRIEPSFIVCAVYLMLGMALVAMCFNLMQEQVIHYFAAMKRALKRICRCKR
ncbi:potassium channel subfamily K member 15 [Plutella xylostella]|uniref:potassium channel subfamily K member 15 n=1 Tax=Plutella xylostella TaxID=51655 RepID=UPI00203295BC|nr:potassium channel subfamily K member 15 [Plutella xylostella]